MGVEFGVLGPVQASRDGVALPVTSAMQRAVLAALLLRRNQVVAVDELARVLWGPAQPSSARVTVQNYVKRLRRALGEAGQRIVTRSPGYLISAAADEVDAGVFEAHLAAARSARRSACWQQAADHAGAALAAWRGEPLCDVRSDELARHHVPRLLELRMEATETGIEALIRLGRHAEVTGELAQLVAAHPLREHLRALQMLALHGDGRQAEALAAYQAAREVMIAELGVEPGAELRGLQRQILTGDLGAVRAPDEAPRQGGGGAAVPRELPAPVRYFTGRARELALLNRLVLPGAQGPATLLISAVSGTAGVGKTALAIAWAHRAARHFADGQLYVDLRGFDPGEPVPPADALAGFLRALGVPGQQIPGQLEGRAGLYRSTLAGRRVLVVLDNARDADQVRPLLPGDPGCVTVVTSRDALAGLVAADGARRLDLDVLPLADAVGLLRSLIGRRADDDREAVAELARLCARLPLALRIAAELAAARRAVPLADLVAELAASRLDVLDAGEDRADVRAVFSWSCRRLPEDAALAFALLGLHPGEDWDARAAAALTGTTTGQAGRVLRRLQRASLIRASGPGRYGMHDLLRDYARAQAAAGDAGGRCHDALTRLLGYYRSAAAAAMDTLVPAESHLRPAVPRPGTAGPGPPALHGEAEARAWLDRERANLVAMVVHCAAGDRPRDATDLAAILFRYLITGSHLPEALTIYGHVLRAARRSGDLAGEATALHGLGAIAVEQGRFPEAAAHYLAALERYRRRGDRVGEARVLHNLGVTEHQLHHCRPAARYYRAAAAACRDIGNRVGVAGALCGLSGVEVELGRYDQAAGHLHRALRVFREVGHQMGEAEALSRIGELHLRRGELTGAVGFFEQAMAVYRVTGQVGGLATELKLLGDVSLRRGDCQQAIGYLTEALALFRRTGYQHGEIMALRSLAGALHAVGRPAAARAELAAALRRAAETGNAYQQAGTHRDLAESLRAAGQDEQARRHWQQALALYAELGAPEAGQVRARLAGWQQQARR